LDFDTHVRTPARTKRGGGRQSERERERERERKREMSITTKWHTCTWRHTCT
jgi:hypothetical protein